MKFTKKPVTIEAVLFTGITTKLPYEFGTAITRSNQDSCFISTLEGEMECKKGDWIIKGVNGEFYPCKPDVFQKTYTPASPYDKVIGDFTAVMRDKMVENTHKGDTWQTMDIKELLDRLEEEYRELVQAIIYDVGAVHVTKEAADIANFAMMVADRYTIGDDNGKSN